MATHYSQNFRSCKTALDLLTIYPSLSGKDGYYMVWPQGSTSPGQLVYCDMTTDGGGWMLIARSHPSGTPTTWGWTGNQEGSIKNFTQPYQAGWWQYWDGNATFTSIIIGNRLNINNNLWGPFIYKYSGLTYSGFMYNDTQQSYTRTVLKYDTTVFNYTSPPSMQAAIGFPTTGTTNKVYYARDCCGFAGYGGLPNAFNTTYINHATLWYYAGPWGAGSTTDGSGNFTQTTGNTNYGGTNQYMIMVR